MRHPIEGGGHSAWLPLDSVSSRPATARAITIDVTIEYEPGEGFILAYASRDDPSISDDMWFGSLSEAERSAEDMFGIGPDRWAPA